MKNTADETQEASLLVDRVEAARLIGCSGITVRRAEDDGSLTAIRLRPGVTSKTYYDRDQVVTFARRGIKTKSANKK